MDLLTSCLLLASGADVSALGSPDWQSREAAESRLRAWGAAAWPFLWSAERSDDPEVRDRAARLLAPYRSAVLESRAMALLADPWPVDAAKLYADWPVRRAVRRAAEARGVGYQWWFDALTPDEGYSCWNWDICKPVTAARALDAARRHFGNDGPGWILSP